MGRHGSFPPLPKFVDVNSEFESVYCNLCGSSDTQKISEIGKFGLPAHVVLCRICGLGYLDPRWNKYTYMKFYQEDYDDYYRPQIHSHRKDFLDNNPILRRLDDNDLLSESLNKVLEIGSGVGENLDALTTTGLQTIKAYAIEPSHESQKQLDEKGVVVIGSDAENEWYLDYRNSFDLVIMRHVLEHLMDPKAILEHLRSVLTDHGTVYIAVPDNLHPSKSGMRTNWYRNVHTYYFNVHTLTTLLQSVGFNILLTIEGDEYNRSELVMVVEKGEVRKAQFDERNFNEQLDVFKKAEREDGRLINRLKRSLRKFQS